MCPKMGVYTKADADADIAAHAAIPDAHHSEEVARGRPEDAVNTSLLTPGIFATGVTTAVFNKDRIWYQPVVIHTPVTTDLLYFEITVAGAGGTKAKIALYHADTDWQPGALVADLGTIAIDVIAIVSLACAHTLQEGRYVIACKPEDDVTFRIVKGGWEASAYESILGATPIVSAFWVGDVYANALQDPGLAWASMPTSNVGFQALAFIHVTVP